MNAVLQSDDEGRLDRLLVKAHNVLMKNAQTRFLASTILTGESAILEDDECPTAYTNGRDKYYGRGFMSKMDFPEMVGVVLHENGHVMLKHIMRMKKLPDKQLANIAADVVINSMIRKLKGYGDWIKLPNPHIHYPKYDGWDVVEVYRDLEKEQSQSGCAITAGGFDVHDYDMVESMDEAQEKELSTSIDKAYHIATTLAGVMGAELPLEIHKSMVREVDWRTELQQYFVDITKGDEDQTWRTFDRRFLPLGYYLPTKYSEACGELVFAVDSSGSMMGDLFNEANAAVARACELVKPSSVRVLHWDMSVNADYTYTDNYDKMLDNFKPRGGGGTMCSCVVEYINQHNIKPKAIIVLTDGYLENNIKWDTAIPTLWLIMQNHRIKLPKGRMVKVKGV